MPPEPKNGIRDQNQYGRVTYPSIGNFTWSKKIYTCGGQKGENKSSEPKNGTKKALSYQKKSFRTKKIKTSRHFKKCMLKKFLSDSVEKTSILDLKEKNKNVFKFSLAIMNEKFLMCD
jgi:hypothetical protein